MAVDYRFHPEALSEYAAAASFYLAEASPSVADAFVTEVEDAIAGLAADPGRWRVVEEPGIRRYSLSRFPFLIYYRWEQPHQRIAIYAVMHCSREPGYWHSRLEK